jgi:hypothetical protein
LYFKQYVIYINGSPGEFMSSKHTRKSEIRRRRHRQEKRKKKLKNEAIAKAKDKKAASAE